MSVTSKNVVTLTVGKGEMGGIRKNAKSAEINGKSNIRIDRGERKAHLNQDSLIGQIGQCVGIRYWFGTTERYLVSRFYQNKTPFEGDGGSDIPGCNVDFKTSLMRYGNDPMKYHLIVRPKEKHEGWIYVHLLVSDLTETSAKVHITGWATTDMLPKEVNSSGPLAGAYVLPVSELNPVLPIRWDFFS